MCFCFRGLLRKESCIEAIHYVLTITFVINWCRVFITSVSPDLSFPFYHYSRYLFSSFVNFVSLPVQTPSYNVFHEIYKMNTSTVNVIKRRIHWLKLGIARYSWRIRVFRLDLHRGRESLVCPVDFFCTRDQNGNLVLRVRRPSLSFTFMVFPSFPVIDSVFNDIRVLKLSWTVSPSLLFINYLPTYLRWL